MEGYGITMVCVMACAKDVQYFTGHAETRERERKRERERESIVASLPSVGKGV